MQLEDFLGQKVDLAMLIHYLAESYKELNKNWFKQTARDHTRSTLWRGWRIRIWLGALQKSLDSEVSTPSLAV